MNFRPIVALPLVLAQCAERATSDSHHTSVEDAGHAASSASNGTAPGVIDAGTFAASSAPVERAPDGGTVGATNEGSATSEAGDTSYKHG